MGQPWLVVIQRPHVMNVQAVDQIRREEWRFGAVRVQRTPVQVLLKLISGPNPVMFERTQGGLGPTGNGSRILALPDEAYLYT